MAQSIVLPNRIKRLLQEGGSVVGCMVVEFRQPSVMQLLANAGFDFVIIDNEHGPFNLETIADLTRAAVHVGLTPIVRVPELTYANIAQSLDAGAQGIMAPRVTAAKEVQDTVRTMKYPPLGVRGAALFRGHTQFHSGPMPENMQAANQETMLVVQIETKEAVESLDSLLSVP